MCYDILISVNQNQTKSYFYFHMHIFGATIYKYRYVDIAQARDFL